MQPAAPESDLPPEEDDDVEELPLEEPTPEVLPDDEVAPDDVALPEDPAPLDVTPLLVALPPSSPAPRELELDASEEPPSPSPPVDVVAPPHPMPTASAAATAKPIRSSFMASSEGTNPQYPEWSPGRHARPNERHGCNAAMKAEASVGLRWERARRSAP